MSADERNGRGFLRWPPDTVAWFSILRLQTAFPDAEALREMDPGRWQVVHIEFEFESKDFLLHMHEARDCDLIVCWKHNWEGCPLEVLELSKLIDKLM